MLARHCQVLYLLLESKLVAYCMRTHAGLASLLCNFGFSGEGYTPEDEAELSKKDAREEADRRPRMERSKYTADMRRKRARDGNLACFSEQWKNSSLPQRFWAIL